MLDQDGIFEMSLSTAHIELEKIHKEICENINEIKEIKIIQDEELSSSALLSLLKTVKYNYSNIKIPLLDEENSVEGLGKIIFVDKNN